MLSAGRCSTGNPLLAEQNIEAMIPVSRGLAQPGAKYFLLRAVGNSMDLAGIEDGDLVLVRQQPSAENGETVVALINEEATDNSYLSASLICKGRLRFMLPSPLMSLIVKGYRIGPACALFC